MELLTALYIGVGIAIVTGIFVGVHVMPRLLYRAVRTDEDNEPGGSYSYGGRYGYYGCSNSYSSNYYSSDSYDSSYAPDFDDNSSDMSWESETTPFYERPLPPDPRAMSELSPIEQEMREAEEYARQNNQNKLKVDEALDNIKL